MSEKAKRVLNVIVNVIVGIIIVLILLLAINVISSKSKGYTSIFGKAFLVVQTDSMKGDGEDNFEAGDLIVIRILSTEEQQNLEVGDVITFYDYNISDSATSLNSHRIIEVRGEGTGRTYITQGDNNEIADKYSVAASNVIGTFVSNWGGIGKVVSWFSSSTGFFVCVVLPSFLIVVYYAVNLFIVIRDNRREKILATGDLAEMTPEEREAYKQQMKADMEAEIKAKLLAEMQSQHPAEATAEQPAEAAEPKVEAATQPTAEATPQPEAAEAAEVKVEAQASAEEPKNEDTTPKSE